MKIRLQKAPRGIALIIVMLVIFVLGMMAGRFAQSMKTEMRLAQNHNYETELEWLGRSGVELARYVLAQQMLIPGQPYDALNQKWSGGISDIDDPMADITLVDNPLGSGKFSVKILDNERKFNINAADETILRQAMNLVGIDAADSSPVVASVLDWCDPDNKPRMNGTESDYYLGLDPPYYAKDGPIDDLSELLMVRGVTPEMYWGPAAGFQPVVKSAASAAAKRIFGQSSPTQGTVGLVDLFTAISGRQININTASAAVLQLIPGIDENVAQAIIQMRAGPDGVEGNEDDIPFRSPQDIVNVPGIGRQMAPQLMRFFTTRSGTFEVHVTAEIDNYKREYIALLRRQNARDIQTLYFYWK